jgi:hypothetical protein
MISNGGSAWRRGAAEVLALRRAGQRQFKRWEKVDLDADELQRCADLRRALRALRGCRDGCELHPIGQEGPG